ncbi:hypothetical protein [Hyphomonas sp.]|uniref:hypothetical protein n=1 Tax=Hyphomonas sp. TaxID=87 RepID=UPI00391C23EE
MKSSILAAAFISLASITACGQGGTDAKDITRSSSGSQIGQAYLKELTTIADALDSVKDESSARAAAAKIRSASTALEGMNDELGQGDMSPLKAMQIYGSHGQAISETYGRIMTSFLRIHEQHPELVEIISNEMDRIGR